MRQPHILRQLKSKNGAGSPELVLAMDVETVGMDPVVLKLGHAIFEDIRLDRSKAYARDVIDFTEADEFWNFVEKHSRHGRALWIINHNVSFDLRVLAFSDHLTKREWEFKKCIFPDPQGPFYVEAKRGKALIRMANLANWYTQQPLAKFGALLGFPKGDVDPTDPRYANSKPGSKYWNELFAYCRRDVEIVVEAVRKYRDFLRDNNMGPFAITLAGQSKATFQYRFMHTDLYIHDNEAALKLERESYFGGRTDVCKRGRFQAPPGEKFWYVDINSMYPSVMRDKPLPTRLLAVERTASIGDLVNSMNNGYLLIARVGIKADPSSREQCCVPSLRDHHLVYAGGTYTATLCTPELQVAIERGIVTHIDEVAVYSGETIFDEYVDSLYKMRQKFKEEGNDIYQYLTKILMNALYGKWGQHNYEWSPSPIAMEEDGIITEVNGVTGEKITIRKIGTLNEIRSQERLEATDSFPAIAAHITSHARRMITEYRELAGFDNVYYLDTDSLFVNEAGLDNLRSGKMLSDTELGKLKVEESSDIMEVVAPKLYMFGDKWKRKGVRKDAEQIGPSTWRGVQFEGFAGALRAGRVNQARISVLEKTLSGEYTKGRIMPDGTILPLEIHDDR